MLNICNLLAKTSISPVEISLLTKSFVLAFTLPEIVITSSFDNEFPLLIKSFLSSIIWFFHIDL
ncbi:MAG: hypothetical protein CM1200mP31_3880 [Candidatus Neomarinimicrobiota bacterium]|nr:MAG: hypothetical protein CM1200mP31_3880 [Candidatus Neomarinimicrobiota bacterium]